MESLTPLCNVKSSWLEKAEVFVTISYFVLSNISLPRRIHYDARRSNFQGLVTLDVKSSLGSSLARMCHCAHWRSFTLDSPA